MHYPAADIVLVLTTLFTGICSVIAALRSNKAANSSKEGNKKLDEAKDKLEEVHKTTNGNLAELKEECLTYKQGNTYLRALLVEYMKIVPKQEILRIKEQVDSKVILKKQLLDSPTYNFRETND